MISAEEKLRFSLVCKEISNEELCGAGIGTYSEKRLHKTLKRFFCDDESCHEVRIKPDGSVGGKGESGKGGYIADIFREGEIIEVQTGSLYSLKAKVKFYLEHTDYIVTVVHPIAGVKYLSWIDTEDGSVRSRRRSPKKGRVTDALPELYWLSDMLDNQRLHFCFPILDIEEFRLLDGWSRDKKRGSDRYERVPTDITDIACVAGKDVPSMLPEGLAREFTRKDFSKLTGFKGRKLYNAITLFCNIGAVQKGEKRGKSLVYRIVT